MKNLFCIIILILSSQNIFAQNDSIDKTQRLEYYLLQGDYVVHYFVDIKSDTMFYDLSLSNGNTLTAKGELINKKGKIIFLKEGQCVDSKGNIDECADIRKKINNKISK
jgi:hypothetical protein